jgi:hypothetical protein
VEGSAQSEITIDYRERGISNFKSQISGIFTFLRGMGMF